MVYGDFPYALKLPIPMSTLKQVAFAARTLLPILSLLPFKLLYPTGESQDVNKPVSYTHLDVYKRQAAPLMKYHDWLGNAASRRSVSTDERWSKGLGGNPTGI